MKAIFEHGGTVVELGRGSIGGLDTENYMLASCGPNSVGLAIYRQDLSMPDTHAQPAKVKYLTSFYMTPSEARAMASALLSAATEARTT